MAETSIGSGRAAIANIAHDHIFSILQLLPVDSIISFSMTCKRFKGIASSDILWELIFRRDLGNESVEGLLASTDGRFSWKKLYQQVFHLDSVSCLILSGQEELFPRPRASHSLNFISQCLVLFGGGYEEGCHLDDTWVACTGDGVRRVLRWQQANLGRPSGRFGHSCVVVGDALVIFGGINDKGVRHSDTWIGHVIQDDALEINVSWRSLDLGPFLPPARGAHAGCCTGDNRMVIHGGIGLGGQRLKDTWILEISDATKSGQWHQIIAHPCPPARSGHTLTWIGGMHMVLFGGRGTGYEVLNDIWLLDMESEYPEWVELKCDLSNAPDGMPLPRVGHSATLLIGGRVLIYGGEDSQRHRKDDFWVLDPNAIPLLKARAQMLNLKRSSGKMWKKLHVDGHLPNCRSFHRACSDQFGHHVYIFGGMVDGLVQPPESLGLRFDGELYLVKLFYWVR